MRYRLLETELTSTLLKFSLSKIYGLGVSRASYVCSLLGLGSSFHILLLNKYFKDGLRFVLLQYSYLLSNNLKLAITQRFEFFVQVLLYKGIRFLNNLPMRGQRTCSNSRSIRRFTVRLKGLLRDVTKSA